MGINLDKPILYKYASLRYFNEGEHHVDRFCQDDVLLLVFDGVLRFSENGQEREVSSGQYYIQRHGMLQEGRIASSSPKYLYVHFLADWSDGEAALPASGSFDYSRLKLSIENLDRLSHSNATHTELTAEFLQILLELRQKETCHTAAKDIAEFISRNCTGELTLGQLAEEFHFSKNYIIRIFKEEYSMTPFAYATHLRMQKAEWLLEVTSDPVESVAYACGYCNYSHFYRVFRKAHQMSPAQWRSVKQNRYT